LVGIIGELTFVTEAEVNSITNITCRNFNNTLVYKKNLRRYVANINFCGYNYKVLIRVEGDKANPQYEKKLKRVFPR